MPLLILIGLALLIIAFLFWRWLLKKFIKSDVKRKVFTWLATLLSTPLIYVASIFILISIISYYPSRDFDKERWHTDKEKRYELSEDLIESQMLIGLTKEEVSNVLGAEHDGSEETDYWTYYLGFRPQLFGIDPDVLSIEFKDGKVIKVTQRET